MNLPLFHPPLDILERTYLAQGYSAGITSLSVDNNNSFALNDRVMIGEIGREKTEIVTVNGAVTPGTSLSIGATIFPHEADEPVTRLQYDSVRYYRSTTGSTGTYDLLITVPLDVDNEDLVTIYDDTAGLSTYFYKGSFFNSVSNQESAQSDAFAATGYTRHSVGFMIDEILREVNDENEIQTSRTEILGWFNEVNDDLLTRVKKPYDFLRTRTTANRVAQDTSGAGTFIPFPADMWKFDRLDYNLIDSTVTPVSNETYTVRILPIEEFRNRFSDTNFSAGSTNNSNALQFAAIDSTRARIRLWPPSLTSATNSFYIYYWKTFTELDSEGDVFETPTPRVYKLYALHKFFLKKTAADPIAMQNAQLYLSRYDAEIAKLRRADRKDAGSPRSFLFLPQTVRGNRKY